MSRTFINQMKKNVLIVCLRVLGINDEGNVDDMRARLRGHLDQGELSSEQRLYIQNLRSTYESAVSTKESKLFVPQAPRDSSPIPVAKELEEKDINLSDVCDKVRKWGVKYDGGKDPLCFLERIEELAMCYSISRVTLLKFMPELLKGEALSWYRNNNQGWTSYNDFVSDFKLFFLPVRFFESLDDDIRNRIQRPNEYFVDYVTSIQSLMRWSNLSTSEQLERIFRNCRAEYKRYIKRNEFKRLQELIVLAKDFESIETQEVSQKIPARRVQTVVATGLRNNVCFRCVGIAVKGV